jgi:hypothetical protein
MQNQEYFSKFNELLDFLNSSGFKTTDPNILPPEGYRYPRNINRWRSIQDEKRLNEILKAKFGNRIQIAPTRTHWWDFTFDGYVFNFKSSLCGTSPDNSGGKPALIWCFTELSEHRILNMDYHVPNALKVLIKHYSPNSDRDYYYLVFNKVTGEFKIHSARTLPEASIKTNVSRGNLPFQIRTDLIQYPQVRDNDSAALFLSKVFTDAYIHVCIKNKDIPKAEECLKNYEELVEFIQNYEEDFDDIHDDVQDEVQSDDRQQKNLIQIVYSFFERIFS